MAKFTAEQAIAVTTIQQLINDWAGELDVNEGLGMAPLLTADCAYTVRGVERQGRDAVVQFYESRLAEFAAAGTETPVQRHILSNLSVKFSSENKAGITFTLVYFTTAGMSSGLKHADPASVADVFMDVAREDDGHWRIARFDSKPIFIRVPS